MAKKKEYELKANLGDTTDGIEYSNQWHSLGTYQCRKIAEQAMADCVKRPDCKAVRLVVKGGGE
jgi:hypothetical protein